MGEWSVLIIQFVIIIAVFYFLLIRPQKKQQQKIQNMLDSMQINDKVVKIKEDEVLIETGSGAEKSQIKFQKSAIGKVLTIHE